MRVRNIHAAVRDRLGVSVLVSSVNCWLRKSADDKGSRVVRLGRGRYRLIRTR
jgi:hypothetical protein